MGPRVGWLRPARRLNMPGFGPKVSTPFFAIQAGFVKESPDVGSLKLRAEGNEKNEKGTGGTVHVGVLTWKKTVSKKAVVRNRVRRRLRAAARVAFDDSSDGQYCYKIVASRRAIDANFEELCSALRVSKGRAVKSLIYRQKTLLSRATADRNVRCIDTGVNITHPIFRFNPEEVLARGCNLGIASILKGRCLRSSMIGLGMAERWAKKNPQRKIPPLLCTAAFLPSCSSLDERGAAQRRSREEKLLEIAQHPLCAAIGECFLEDSSRHTLEEQTRVLREHIKVAIEVKKPLYLATRSGVSNDITSEFGNDLPLTCIRSFRGTAEEASECVNRGFFIGVDGFLCKKGNREKLSELLKAVPLNRLLLETNAPLMRFKAKRYFTEPIDILDIAEIVASESGRTPAELHAILLANARRFFGLL
eukprot:g2364.t1